MTWPPTKPAAPAIGLEYWNISPNLLVGCMVPSVAIAPAGVSSPNSNSHSRSWRGRPVQAQIRCLTSTWRVVSASPSLNDGSTEVTGVSHVSLPCSTSLASSSVVSALVFEATMNSVSASTGLSLPSSRTPKPPVKTTLPSCTMPTATPGTRSSFMPVSTKRASSARRASSSRWAFLPAKVSRVKPFGSRRSKMRPTCAPRFSATGSLMS